MLIDVKDTFQAFALNAMERFESYSGIIRYPIKGEVLEELLTQAFEAAGLVANWNMGSHSPGSDISMVSKNGHKISLSVKSALIKGVHKKKMSISSFRTTKYKTLEEKLDYFDGPGKNFDYYLVLARMEDKNEKRTGFREYILYLMESDFIQAKDMVWKEVSSGWQTERCKNGHDIKIQKAMSDQFWIYLNYGKLQENDKVHKLGHCKIPVEQLGKTHKLVYNDKVTEGV